MKKLLGIMVCLSVLTVYSCSDDQTIDSKSLLTLTSGFSSSYMFFDITGGVSPAPEHKVLNLTSGLSLNGANYEGTFEFTGPAPTFQKHTVSIVLPSPAKDAEYREGSLNLFSYTRGATDYTIYINYSTENDFIVTITDWGGTGGIMKATFSGVVYNGSSIADCLVIENGTINAQIR